MGRMAQNAQRLRELSLRDLTVDDGFWNERLRLVTDEMIPYQLDILTDRVPGAPPSRCVRNLRIAAGLEQGTFEGFVFQDTDLAKWLEAVAYSLTRKPDPALEKTADELIDLVCQAQRADGYLNSCFSTLHPGHQFCNLKEGHELYTAGHFMEAAVAYFEATGKEKLLVAMCRFADLICQVFQSPEYEDAVPGHEEIELALMRLYEITHRERYRAMAYDFINRRGTTDYLSREAELPRFIDVWHDRNPYIPEYGQAQAPVREQTAVEGHAVRALYLLSGMADAAGSYEDEGLLDACRRLYENVTQRRMYITGGVGSSGILERFTADFDLPNDSAYAESCASIALAMFSKRMARVTGEARYMDTAELALYNTVLAGMALDGKSFFYVNPLEVTPSFCKPATDKAHVEPRRRKWFGCACCPPNIARTVASVGGYVFFTGDRELRLNLFIGGTYKARLGETPVTVTVRSELPWKGRVSLELTARECMEGRLLIRVPDYAEDPRFTLNGESADPPVEKGYAVLELSGWSARASLDFDMPARLMYADPRVTADAGKAAVKKGPLVYCLEETDNGGPLSGLRIDPEEPLTERFEPALLGGVNVVEARGQRIVWDGGLYSAKPPGRTPATLRLVPYCFWGNREPGEMAVWVRLKC